MACEPKTTQDDPTAPRPIDPNGRALDQWGLPLSGPARAAALAEAGRVDPHVDPEGWNTAPVAPAPPAEPDATEPTPQD